MSLLKVVPHFAPEGNGFYFSHRDLNSFQRAKYNDDFGFWQAAFGLFGYMQLTHDYKYVVHSPKGLPFAWNSYKACSHTESGNITIGTREVTPCALYMKLKYCHDILLDSCYRQMIAWDAGGRIGLDPEGQRMFQMLTEEIMANGSYGLRLLLTLGQLYSTTSEAFPGFESNVTSEIKDLFATATTGCKGWVKLFIDMAASGDAAHLNLQGLITEDQLTEDTYEGDVVTLFEQLKAKGPKPLRSLINKGGMMDAGRARGAFKPLFVVSDSVYNAVVQAFNDQAESALQNDKRITRYDARPANAMTPTYVYYIDGVPVVPLCDVNGYDDYVKGTLHFAGIIASGNIQLGTNFARIPKAEEDHIGMMVEKSTSIVNNDFGTYHMLSHALVQVSLADADYAVATILQGVGEAETTTLQP